MLKQKLELMEMYYEPRRLDDKPATEPEPCEFVFVGKVKTCGKHGILCEEL